MNYAVAIVRVFFCCFVLSGIGLFLYGPHFFRWVAPEKSIHVVVWPTEIDPEFMTDFEQKTGIKVYFSYVEMNEEVLAKVKLSGADGYDLIMASDYMIELMAQKDLLQPLQKDKFEHWNSLHKGLLNCYFDPGNTYSIPFFWDAYGLCVDTRYISVRDAESIGWGLIFDRSKLIGSIGMIEDYREAAILAGTYLWQNTNVAESLDELSLIRDLLRNQKKWVARYTDARAGAVVASELGRCAVTISTDIVRLQRHHPHIQFIVPNYGKYMIIDSVALPKTTKKQEYVYEFLNYLYDAKVLQLYANKHTLRTAHRQVQADTITDKREPTAGFMSEVTFFRMGLSEEKLTQLWVSVLS